MIPALDVLVIGGTGFYAMPELVDAREVSLETPFGAPSSPLKVGTLGCRSVAFLARHGLEHQWLPHQVNYRANVFAAHMIGADAVVAIHAVGSLNESLPPCSALLPDQLIDYTWGREHTYTGDHGLAEQHVDFTAPFDPHLRQALAGVAQLAGPSCRLAAEQATYGVTQGPRLETAAEIRRLQRDGCDVVGMTAMPEAGLARELGLALASISVVANWAAGFGPPGPISMAEIHSNLERGTAAVRELLLAWCQAPAAGR